MKKLRITVNGVSYDVEVEVVEDDDMGGASYGFPPVTYSQGPAEIPSGRVSQQPISLPPRPVGASGANQVTSPIAGVIVEVKVAVGAVVKENDLLVIIEAMKMHTNLSSPTAGKIKEILVKPGDAIQQGQVVVTFE